jgi:hypothetical protein
VAGGTARVSAVWARVSAAVPLSGVSGAGAKARGVAREGTGASGAGVRLSGVGLRGRGAGASA